MNESRAERHDIQIESDHVELSALTACYNRRVLDAFGFDRAFWIISDDTPAHKSVALLGRQYCDHLDSTVEPADSWMVVSVKTKRSKHSSRKDTDDPECVTRVGSWIYIVGSHFGSKSGPLDPERHFIARFNESLVEICGDRLKTKMEVCRVPFALHRAINDAVTQRDIALLPEGPHVLANYIRSTIAHYDGDKPKWRERLHHSDRPINIEGVAFLPNGRLLVGLRYPVTADGQPILVEIDGVDRLFAKKGQKRFGRLKATRVFILPEVGCDQTPAGIRAMIQRGRTIYAVTGDLDSNPEKSQVLADHAAASNTANQYHVFDIPDSPDYGVVKLKVKTERTFDDDDNIEGIAVTDDGKVWFVHDWDDRIHLTILTL